MKTKAAVLYETGKPLVVEELELPPLKQGQVLVRMLCSGVCHSQINEARGLKGKDKYLPHLLGHEGSGIVESVGTGVAKVKKDDYVVLSWIKGDGMDAPSSQYAKGALRINSGAIATFSEYSIISENRLFKVPKEIPPDIAALLGCAIPTGAGIIKNEIMPGKDKSIVIFGIGGVGSSALLYACCRGCSKIIAVDINDSKLALAKGLGATHIINPHKENALLKIMEITNGGADYSVECSGAKEAMEMAFESIKNNGAAVLAGNLKDGEKISINPFKLIEGRKIIGTCGGRTDPDKDIPFYAQQYLLGNFAINKLITKTYSLGEINNALTDLEEGRVLKPIINFFDYRPRDYK